MPMRSGKPVEHLKAEEQLGIDNLHVIWAKGSTLYLLENLQMNTPLGDPLRSAQSQPILDIGNICYTACQYEYVTENVTL